MQKLLVLAILAVLLLGHFSTRDQAPTGFNGSPDAIPSKQVISEDTTANDESEAPDFVDIFFYVLCIFGCIAWAAVFVVMFIVIRDGE